MSNYAYIDKNHDYFLSADLKGYIGEYVAIHNDKVQYHHKELKEVYAFMKNKYPEVIPFITQVCSAQAMIL